MNDEMKLLLSKAYGSGVTHARPLPEKMKDEIKSFDDTSRYEPMNKIIKSYALDTKTIEAIDRVSSDMGIKSRSETLREIVRRYEEWHRHQNTQN